MVCSRCWGEGQYRRRATTRFVGGVASIQGVGGPDGSSKIVALFGFNATHTIESEFWGGHPQHPPAPLPRRHLHHPRLMPRRHFLDQSLQGHPPLTCPSLHWHATLVRSLHYLALTLNKSEQDKKEQSRILSENAPHNGTGTRTRSHRLYNERSPSQNGLHPNSLKNKTQPGGFQGHS
jgi:hypothetical protein